MSAIYWLRTASLDRLERLYAGQPYETGMMQAILIGETAKLDKVWTEEYRSTGTFHALVISGAHVAVLAAFLLFLLRICFVPPMPANLLTVLASWLYALVTGWQAPVVRSAAGFTLFMIGRFFYRECSHHEPAGGGGHWVSGARSGADVRRQLSAFVPGGRLHRGIRRAAWSSGRPGRWRRALA